MNDFFIAPLELKFTDGAPAGEFSGYGAVFGNTDSHGDVIQPGAFADSIAERKAQGRAVPMHLMHRVYGGDGLPVGVWTNLIEDDKGLKVTGKISGMNTDTGRLLYERVKDGALGGLSIGYKVRPNGASYGKKAGEPKRTLKSLDLREISLVDDPSNALSRVDEMKRLGRKALMEDDVDPVDFTPDVEEAVEAIAAAIVMQDKVMQGYFGGSSAKDAALLMDSLRDGYEALTGERAPEGLDGWSKSAATIREIERMLREEFKLSRAEAAEVAARRFITQRASGEGSEQPANSAAAFMQALLSK
jgi:HK97 family phage prohead protease